MNNLRVNYDSIASTYNQRFASGGQKGVVYLLADLTQQLHAQRVLEVGCGTGHWLVELMPAGPQLYGLDLSSGMLAQAHEQQVSLLLTQGAAERLPYQADCFDLVYSVNAIHHFIHPPEYIAEAWRLLRPGGALVVIGMQPRWGDWYVYHYFTGTYETDLKRFPTWGSVLDCMVEAGFRQAEWRPVETICSPKVGREVLADPFLEKNSTSQLVLLSDEDYQAGLSRLRKALDESEVIGEQLEFPVLIQLEAMIARK
jgi:ubiquinone/menaquinone biosynthesis C-methylase UbiE